MGCYVVVVVVGFVVVIVAGAEEVTALNGWIAVGGATYCWYWYFLIKYVLISSGELSSLLAIVSSCCISTGSLPNKNILMILSASSPKCLFRNLFQVFEEVAECFCGGIVTGLIPFVSSYFFKILFREFFPEEVEHIFQRC